MPAVDSLSSDLAAKAHLKAVNRDYVLEPRLGVTFLPGRRFVASHLSCLFDLIKSLVVQITEQLEASAVLWLSSNV